MSKGGSGDPYDQPPHEVFSVTGQQFINVLYGALGTIIATGLPILIYWMKMQFAALRLKDAQQQSQLNANTSVVVDLHSVVKSNADKLPMDMVTTPNGDVSLQPSGTQPAPLPSAIAPAAGRDAIKPQAFAPPAPGSTQRV